MYELDTWTIGNIIKMLREEQEISGTELSYGLCSMPTLSRIEADEREMNVIFSMVLFGRLGFHPDKYELFGTQDEYAQYEQRESIVELKKSCNYEQMEQELTEYQKNWQSVIAEDILQQQFVNRMAGFLCLQKGEHEQALELLKKAVEATIPEWEEQWQEKAVVGLEELESMEILADAFEAIGDWKEAFLLRQNILAFLEKKPTNRKQMLEIYTKIITKLVPVMLEQKNVGQALKLCEDALAALSEGGRIFYFPNLLYWKGRCQEALYHMGEENQSSLWETYIRALLMSRLFHNTAIEEATLQHLDKEVPGWDSIRLERL